MPINNNFQMNDYFHPRLHNFLYHINNYVHLEKMKLEIAIYKRKSPWLRYLTEKYYTQNEMSLPCYVHRNVTEN